MTKWEKAFFDMGVSVMFVCVSAIIGLLLAFPIKWTWNFTMPFLFEFPLITWGKAWCLHFLANCLIKSTLLNPKRSKDD